MTKQPTAYVAAILSLIPGSEVTDTGGGCKAIHCPAGPDAEILLTDASDGYAVPKSGEGVLLGAYTDEEGWLDIDVELVGYAEPSDIAEAVRVLAQNIAALRGDRVGG